MFSSFKIPFVNVAAVIINLFVMASGTSFAWSSPALAKLKDKNSEDNTLGREITTSEESLIASLYLVGAVVGPPFTSYFSEKIGRKKTMLIFTVPLFTGCILKAFAEEIWIYYLARFLCGTSAATAFTVIPIYVAEIADNSNRGSLGTYVALLTVIGYLFSYGVGPYVSILWLSLGCAAFSVLFFVCLLFIVPESPYYLLAKGLEDEALKSLCIFRQKSAEEAKPEMEVMKKTLVLLQAKGNLKELLNSRGLRLALGVLLACFVFQQFSGNFAVLAYLQPIFIYSGNAETLTSQESSIIIGVVKIVACLITPFVIDRWGRRLLLIISCFGVALTLFALGTYFHLLENKEDVSNLQWLPITSLILFVMSFNIGLASVPLLLIGELFPQKYKSAAGAVIIIFSSALSFVIAFSFPYMKDDIGLGPSFWIYAGFSAVGSVFCFFMVPETKGKSFVEIQEMLNKEPSSDK